AGKAALPAPQHPFAGTAPRDAYCCFRRGHSTGYRMTSVALPATRKKLPLLYVAALARLAAAASAARVLAGLTLGDHGVLQVVPLACALAAAVAIVFGLPLHALFQVSGLGRALINA